MVASHNCIVQSTVDIPSKYFLKEFAKKNNSSIAEISGAIIRQFIFNYSQGSDAYKTLKSFMATYKKGGSYAL